MNNQEVVLLAQLLNTMDEAVEKLEQAYNSKKVEEVENLKKEILSVQRKIAELVK